MSQVSRYPSNWIPVPKAAARMGMSPTTLRRLIAQGVFTRLRKSPSRTAELFVPALEVEAFEVGGADRVVALRATPPIAAGA